MSANKIAGAFDRSIGRAAWFVFWAIIGGLCTVLKIYFRFFRRELDEKISHGVGAVRVAFCENGAGYGGAVISLAAFLEHLPANYQAVIYTSIGSEPYSRLGEFGKWKYMPPIGLLDREKLNSGKVPFASLLDNLFNLLPYACRYYIAFKRDRVQIVYLNNDASCNFAAAIAAKFAGIPLILHARGFNCDTRGNRWVLSKLDHCIAVSTAVKRNVFHLGVDEKKCTVVPEGLDLEIFHPRGPSVEMRKELQIQEDQPVITLVGGLVDWKGQDVLLDAAPLIFQRHPTAVILLVGGAYGKDKIYADTITKRVSEEKPLSRVRLLGMRDDVADILACSDIVVHASTKPEPFGRTFLEGMAIGRAVIASNEGGPVDVITHNFDGLLIEPRSAVKLAEAINELLADPVRKAKLGSNAAQKAVHYSIENHTSAICFVLGDMLQEKFVGRNGFDGVIYKMGEDANVLAELDVEVASR